MAESFSTAEMSRMLTAFLELYPETLNMEWTAIKNTTMAYPVGAPWWDYKEFAAAVYFLNQDGPGLTFIPLLVGVLFDGLLIGILWAQAYWWFHNSRTMERRIIKAAVWGLVINGTVVWLLGCVWICYTFGYQYGQFYPFVERRWYAAVPFFNSIVVGIVQIFYAERAYKMLGKKKIVLALVLVPILVAIVGAFGILIDGMVTGEITELYKKFMWFWIVGTLVSDTIVTSIVLWSLSKNRSQFEHTDALVKRLIRISCESQIPPTCFGLAFLITYQQRGISFFLCFFGIIEPQFYSIGMLYVLNSRTILRREAQNPSSSNGRVHAGAYTLKQPRPDGSTSMTTSQAHGHCAIQVETETYVEMHRFNPHILKTVIEPRYRRTSNADQYPHGIVLEEDSDDGHLHGHGDTTAGNSEVGLTEMLGPVPQSRVEMVGSQLYVRPYGKH